MAKNKIERIDQEITKVREKIAEYQEKLKALETQKPGRQSGDRADGARTAYDPGSLSAMLSGGTVPAVWLMTTPNRRKTAMRNKRLLRTLSAICLTLVRHWALPFPLLPGRSSAPGRGYHQ